MNEIDTDYTLDDYNVIHMENKNIRERGLKQIK